MNRFNGQTVKRAGLLSAPVCPRIFSRLLQKQTGLNRVAKLPLNACSLPSHLVLPVVG